MLVWAVFVLLTIECVLQLEDVVEGLAYMHEQEMAHGDLKGVRSQAPCLPTISNLYREGEHRHRRELPCAPRRLWSTEDHIGNHEPRAVFEFVHTGRHISVDEPRTFVPRGVWS